jgi:hypothetical protein
MTTRRTPRPLSSFLLRVAEERVERVARRYELLDLRGGGVHRFSSLAALARFLRAQTEADVDKDALEPPRPTGAKRSRRRK